VSESLVWLMHVGVRTLEPDSVGPSAAQPIANLLAKGFCGKLILSIVLLWHAAAGC
jgi:hypothetical protein